MEIAYKEAKQKIDEIHKKYISDWDMIFQCAIQAIIQFGASNIRNDAWFQSAMDSASEREDQYKHYEIEFLKCARELSEMDAATLFYCIQTEFNLFNVEGDKNETLCN